MTTSKLFVGTCEHCKLNIGPGELVALNGKTYHAEACFAEGLRAKTFSPEELSVAFAPSVPPMVAYRCGKQFVAIVVASRRKTKRAPIQQAFSASGFTKKARG
jgi:hypothetical protein